MRLQLLEAVHHEVNHEGRRRRRVESHPSRGMLLAVSADPAGGSLDERDHVISEYIAEAPRRAQYRIVDDGLFCATVAGLPGVIATGKTLEACRSQLAEVIEEWLLVGVSQGRRAEPTCRPAPSPSVPRTSAGIRLM